MTKYKYSRKEFHKKYGNDMPYHLRVELLATKPEKEEHECIFTFTIDGNKVTADKCIECGLIAPSPLDEIEEIEEIIKYKPVCGKNKGQWVSPDIGEISFVINQLIRNQKKIISYLKQK